MNKQKFRVTSTAAKQKMAEWDPAFMEDGLVAQLGSQIPCCNRKVTKPPKNEPDIECNLLLTLLCREKGWHDPVFRVTSIEIEDSDVRILFVCKVIIPEIGCFVSNKASRSPAEAKNQAAHYVLQRIDLSNKNQDPNLLPTFSRAPGTPVYQYGLSSDNPPWDLHSLESPMHPSDEFLGCPSNGADKMSVFDTRMIASEQNSFSTAAKDLFTLKWRQHPTE